MFGFITGKIKTAIIIAFSVALPVIYVLGRLGGGSRAKNAVLKDELKTAQKRSGFYKAMQDHETQIQADSPRNRDELVERMRKTGL
tara:strand:+ start:696 stop:953 length:258 start_codon:yes stop_codon:yes gene_type:complete